METEFLLTAVINVMSHRGEIRKKTERGGRKHKYYLAIKDTLELGNMRRRSLDWLIVCMYWWICRRRIASMQ